MANHFTTIGFPIHDEESYRHYAQMAFEHGGRVDTPAGAYVRWRAGAGAELWLQLDPAGQVVGMVPHFAGGVRRRVGVTRDVRRPDDGALDGALHGWANPTNDDPESGDFPFVFDLPDFDRVGAMAIPATVEVQLSAFAHQIEVHESDEAFAAAQGTGPGFAAESFIPSGLFPSDDGGEPGPPRAEAVFAGHVVESALRTNPVTGAPFHWALVHSFGGAIDVVADPELVPASMPNGGVVHGSFWLSGRIPGTPVAPRAKRAAWRWVSRE